MSSMTRADKNSKENGYDRKRTIVLCLFSIGMIAANCESLLGSFSSILKYASLVLFIVFGLSISLSWRFDVKRVMAIGFFLLVLIAEIPFQSQISSGVQVTVFFVLFALLFLLSDRVLTKPEQLFYCGLVSIVTVLILLAATPALCIQQLTVPVWGRIRLYGSFTHPNSLGAICLIIFFCLYTALLRARLSKKQRACAIVAICIAFLLAILANSRTSIMLIILIPFIERGMFAIKRVNNRGIQLLGVTILIVVASYVTWTTVSSLYADTAFRMRIDGLSSVQSSSYSLLLGGGYLSSDYTSEYWQASGSTDMLWVSLIYKVGLIGLFAYIIVAVVLVSTRRKSLETTDCLAFTLILFLLTQSITESVLSTVMSYYSAFSWILLAALPQATQSKANNTRE